MRQDVQRRPTAEPGATPEATATGIRKVAPTEAEPTRAVEAWALAPHSHKLVLIPMRTGQGRVRGRALLDM